ncbi:Phage DNA binding protein [Brachybacterium faecium]|nr:Phage DNA binding protein [Brachybacterium faecium]
MFKLIEQWATDRNLHTADPNKQMLKLMEETGELASAMARSNDALTKDAVGDIVVVLTVLCTQLNISVEECIQIAYNEIKDRKGKMVNGVFIKEADL